MPEQKAVEYLMAYDPQFSEDAEAFVEEIGSNAVVNKVNKLSDLFEIPKKYAMVRYLELNFHGSPGMMWMPDKGVCVASYFGSLVQASNMLCRNARVFFLGCSVAGGPNGDTTLDEIGKKMFTGTGGIVGASTVSTMGHGSFLKMSPFSVIDGLLKVRRYDENGDRIGSENIDMFGKVWHSTVGRDMARQ